MIKKNSALASQTKSSQAQQKFSKKGRKKLKRLTGLPVSLEGLQEVSHGFAFISPSTHPNVEGLTWRFTAGVQAGRPTLPQRLLGRVPLRQRLAHLRLDGRLVHRRCSLHIARERRARGHQVVFHRLPIRGAGRDADARCINALLRHQVVLGVHGALRGEHIQPSPSCASQLPSPPSRSWPSPRLFDSPTTTAFASACRCRSSATSSRQALASLSTRVGRLVSVAKVIEQSACVFGAGGTTGATIVTLVVALAVWPLSSDTLHVIPTAPVGAPAERVRCRCAAAGNRAAGRRVAVGQRTVLRAHADRSYVGAVAWLDRRRIRRAADRRRLKCLHRKGSRAVRRLARLQSFLAGLAFLHFAFTV